MDFSSDGATTLRMWARDGSISAKEFARMNYVADSITLDVRSMESSGSTLVPNQFYRQFFEAMDKVAPVHRVSTVIRTEGGGPLDVPAGDDTAEGAIKAEGSQATSEDAGFRSIPLGAFTYISKQLPVSVELMDDGGNDFLNQLMGIMAKRLGRITNSHFTNGSGVGQPTGIVTASSLGVTTASETEIEYDELLDAQHSVSESYQATSAWMMSLPTLRSIVKLTDDNGNLAYRDGLLLGKSIVLNKSMPSVEAGSKPILFGDFSAYLIREVDALQFRRYRERYAELGQVALSAILRADGNLGDVNAVKHVLMSS